MRKFLVCLGAVALTASAASAKELQAVDGVKVLPVRIAQVYADGSFGPWIEYTQSRDILSDTLVFDNAEPDTDGSVSGVVGAPIGFNSCGLGEPEDPAGNRWYFGTTYDNPFAANDMTADSGGGSDANDMMLGWHWGGPALVDRNCFIVISTHDSNAINDNTGLCDTPVQQGDPSFLGGVILDFGPLTGNPGHYWYTTVEDLSTGFGISVPIPADLIGAYHVILGTYTTDPTTDGVLDDTVEGGTQPMLWGSGADEAIGGVADVRPGDQNEWQWDDDFVIDGTHQAPDECYNYAFGVCPDPLGSMLALWVAGGGGGCAWDLDGDGDTDFNDLVTLLAGYGTTYDFSDLVGLLGDYGCTP